MRADPLGSVGRSQPHVIGERIPADYSFRWIRGQDRVRSETTCTLILQSGWRSWRAPYIARVCALVLQVDGHLPVDKFAKAAIDTADYVSISLNGIETKLGPVTNPARLIERFASNK